MEMTMTMPTNYVEMTDEEMMYVDGGGFIGVEVRIRTAKYKIDAEWAGVAATAAVVALFNTTPAAAFSGLIGGVAGKSVKDSVKRGYFTIPVGVNIILPIRLSYAITI